MSKVNVKERVLFFLMSLLSRKFLVALATAFLLYNNALVDNVVSPDEMLAVIAPLMAFLGIEGIADIKERSVESK